MNIGYWALVGGAFLGVALLALTPSIDANAQDPDHCSGLRGMTLDAAYVTSADVVEAADGMPAYCRVRATALPAISIEVRLPV